MVNQVSESNTSVRENNTTNVKPTDGTVKITFDMKNSEPEQREINATQSKSHLSDAQKIPLSPQSSPIQPNQVAFSLITKLMPISDSSKSALTSFSSQDRAIRNRSESEIRNISKDLNLDPKFIQAIQVATKDTRIVSGLVKKLQNDPNYQPSIDELLDLKKLCDSANSFAKNGKLSLNQDQMKLLSNISTKLNDISENRARYNSEVSSLRLLTTKQGRNFDALEAKITAFKPDGEAKTFLLQQLAKRKEIAAKVERGELGLEELTQYDNFMVNMLEDIDKYAPLESDSQSEIQQKTEHLIFKVKESFSKYVIQAERIREIKSSNDTPEIKEAKLKEVLSPQTIRNSDLARFIAYSPTSLHHETNNNHTELSSGSGQLTLDSQSHTPASQIIREFSDSASVALADTHLGNIRNIIKPNISEVVNTQKKIDESIGKIGKIEQENHKLQNELKEVIKSEPFKNILTSFTEFTDKAQQKIEESSNRTSSSDSLMIRKSIDLADKLQRELKLDIDPNKANIVTLLQKFRDIISELDLKTTSLNRKNDGRLNIDKDDLKNRKDVKDRIAKLDAINIELKNIIKQSQENKALSVSAGAKRAILEKDLKTLSTMISEF